MRKHRIQNTDYRTQTAHYKKQKKCLGSEQGIVLVVALLLLLVATVVGITALSTTTTTVMISGNQRLSEINFRSADSCIYVSVPIIEQSLDDKQVPAIYSSLVPDSTFPSETRLDSDCPVQSPDCASPAPDLRYISGSGATAVTVSADFDYAYPTSSPGEPLLQFHAEGTGISPKIPKIWKISCFAEGPLGSQANVCGIYRHVPGEE